MGDLDCVGEGGEFDVCGGTVSISSWIIWCAFNGLGVRFDCAGIIRCFEQCIAFFSRCIRFPWINVRQSLVLGFCLLCIAKFGEDLGSTMFRQTTLETLDRFIVIPQLDIIRSNPAECPTHISTRLQSTVGGRVGGRGTLRLI